MPRQRGSGRTSSRSKSKTRSSSKSKSVRKTKSVRKNSIDGHKRTRRGEFNDEGRLIHGTVTGHGKNSDIEYKSMENRIKEWEEGPGKSKDISPKRTPQEMALNPTGAMYRNSTDSGNLKAIKWRRNSQGKWKNMKNTSGGGCGCGKPTIARKQKGGAKKRNSKRRNSKRRNSKRR